MATTMTLTSSNYCAAGNHFTLTATGDIDYVVDYTIVDFTAPLTDFEKAAFMKAMCRFAKVTRTAAQVKNMLATGMVVTL